MSHSTLPFPVIKMVVIVKTHSGMNKGWLFDLCCGTKLSIPERTNLKIREAVLGALFLKNTERGASAL